VARWQRFSLLQCSPLEHRLHAVADSASQESSENVRAYSATPKELKSVTSFASTESHNRLGNDDPDPVGIFWGMGTEDRGRALAKREPALTLQRHEPVGQTLPLPVTATFILDDWTIAGCSVANKSSSKRKFFSRPLNATV
jgi:hypothetical protein